MKKEPIDQMNLVSINFLEKIGITDPPQEAINFIEATFSHICVTQNILFDVRLNEKEKKCLYWAAKGKTTEETAEIMNVLKNIVETCRKSIKKKLRANTMAQAIFEGIRLGYF
jgi:DNA-binding CsgD family transcriptional regulator